MAATLLGGVTLIIVPLLALGADQLQKGRAQFMNKEYFPEIINLDKMSLGDKKELFGIIKNYNARRRPVFLYASPQTLDGLKKELTEITMKDILRLVVIDEYHF